jgi:hypothetical protein
MRDLKECSGIWGGFWIQGLTRGQMTLRLVIRGNIIAGGGQDISGPFEMHGEYDPQINQVVIDKAYPWLKVIYVGDWDGQMIAGTWFIPEQDAGVFEMWPQDEELSLEKLRESTANPEVQAPALPARS